MSLFDWLTKTAIPWFTSLGLTSRTVTLEVRGRKTGRPIRVSLSRTHYGGNRYFVSLPSLAAIWGELMDENVPHARIVEIPKGHHYCFIKHEDFVFNEMSKFFF